MWPALFALGIVLAISGGAKLPDEGQDWPDSLPIFLVGAGLAVVGLVGWRRAVAQARLAPAADGDAATDPFALLEAVLPPARTLAADLPHLSGSQIEARVDDLLSGFIHPLAEARQRVIDRLGMGAGAEILVTVAYGERMLNRTWSAAADGHLPEAGSAYPDALQALEHAADLARRAVARAGSP